MSSSCRKLALPVACGAALLSAAATATHAADRYFAPFISLQTEYNSNRSMLLDTEEQQSGEGYVGELGAIMGWRTPRSTFDVRPKLVAYEYPDQEDLQRTEQFLDMKWDFNTQRSRTEIFGKYTRRDAFTAELAPAEFDPLDPQDPITGETGRVVADNTRTRFHLRPSFEYAVSPRTGIGISLIGEDVGYDTSIPGEQFDYTYTEAEGFVRRTLSERTDITAGVYASRYDADQNGETTDGYGVNLGWLRTWSPEFQTSVTLIVERSETELGNGVEHDPTTDWGVDFFAIRRWEVSRILFSGGRTFSPTGGGKTVTDQLRAQYWRDFSERMSFSVAARGIRSRSQFEEDIGNDRDYVRADLSLRYLMSRTWFVEGGYGYLWQEYKSDPAAADNHNVFLKFGYEGLLPE